MEPMGKRKTEFKPDWKLTPAEALAVTLSMSLHKHVPGWGGCTDEQLGAVAIDVLEHVMTEREALGFQKSDGK
jgi:hypothetical protein